MEDLRRALGVNRPGKNARRGFSLMEMVLAVAVIAILAMIAVPALASIAPSAQMRSAARGAASLLRQARLMAENSHRPARVAFDCRAGSCQARLYAAVFNPEAANSFKEWAETPGTARDLGRRVSVAAAAGSAPVSGNPDGLYWAVFMPDGGVRASHEPLRLVFSASGARGAPWELAVNKATGRATLQSQE